MNIVKNKTMPKIFAVEGLDILGKSTLIQGIKDTLGFHQVIHFSKPEKLAAYNGDLQKYQEASFRNSMELIRSNGHLIFDRWHLGEVVYSPLYRGYDGSYVYQLEKDYQLDWLQIRLILLTENFATSKHFVDDGESFDITKREQEQNMFLEAFGRSIIYDKRNINVTADNGSYRNKADILAEALS